MHTKERERESVIEMNLKVQKTINIAEYEQLWQPIIDTKNKIK